jgi:hypothetical protein
VALNICGNYKIYYVVAVTHCEIPFVRSKCTLKKCEVVAYQLALKLMLHTAHASPGCRLDQLSFEQSIELENIEADELSYLLESENFMALLACIQVERFLWGLKTSDISWLCNKREGIL